MVASDRHQTGGIALQDTAQHKPKPLEPEMTGKDDDPARSFKDFEKLTDQFFEEPSIENYIVMRRRYPSMGIEAARFAGLDPLLAIKDELQRFGIDPLVIGAALDGDDREIDELCLQLMEALIKRRALEKAGNTHLQRRRQVAPDSLIDYLVITMLEVIERDGCPLPASLIILIRERLGGPYPALYRDYLIKQKRKDAAFLGFHLLHKGEEPSIRRVAQIMGVQPSTVSRWFPDGDFWAEVERWQRMLTKFGSKPLPD